MPSHFDLERGCLIDSIYTIFKFVLCFFNLILVFFFSKIFGVEGIFIDLDNTMGYSDGSGI
jgi:hypothetical protein